MRIGMIAFGIARAMLSMKDLSMAGCTDLAYQLVVACGALQSLAAVNSIHLPTFAKPVGAICVACQNECEKFPNVAECKACGAACKACAEGVPQGFRLIARKPSVELSWCSLELGWAICEAPLLEKRPNRCRHSARVIGCARRPSSRRSCKFFLRH
jgi:hypothetical protein